VFTEEAEISKREDAPPTVNQVVEAVVKKAMRIQTLAMTIMMQRSLMTITLTGIIQLTLVKLLTLNMSFSRNLVGDILALYGLHLNFQISNYMRSRSKRVPRNTLKVHSRKKKFCMMWRQTLKIQNGKRS